MATTTTPSTRPTRTANKYVVRLFIVAAVAAGLGFSVKIFEFMQDMLNSSGMHFAGAHLAVYFCVAGGCLMLLAYTFFSGHFSDIEKPKYELLEREIKNDREEFGGS